MSVWCLAIDLVNEIPPKEVTERVVWCNGGDEHLGHPKVFINLVKKILLLFETVDTNFKIMFNRISPEIIHAATVV